MFQIVKILTGFSLTVDILSVPLKRFSGDAIRLGRTTIMDVLPEILAELRSSLCNLHLPVSRIPLIARVLFVMTLCPQPTVAKGNHHIFSIGANWHI